MNRFVSALKAQFPVEEGYTLNVLDHQFEGFVSWRLDVATHHWIYLEWAGSCMVASSSIVLSDDELLGFLKAKFPEMNVRRELVDAVVEKLTRLIEEFEKEDLL